LKRLKQAINCNNADQAAKIIQEALGIESDEVANDLSLAWPARQRARIIGIVLRIEALFGPDNRDGRRHFVGGSLLADWRTSAGARVPFPPLAMCRLL
jgi:hypothetical protein